MGSNSTQGMATLLFLVGFTVVAMGFFSSGSVLWVGAGLVVVGLSAALFMKAKPWEHAGH